MPYLQFLNGSRDQEFVELNSEASLILGSGESAHLRCTDEGIEAEHAVIYPGEGAFWLKSMDADTVHDMQRLAPETTQKLDDRAVFIVGKTVVKFWSERPSDAPAAPVVYVGQTLNFPGKSGDAPQLVAANSAPAVATSGASTASAVSGASCCLALIGVTIAVVIYLYSLSAPPEIYAENHRLRTEIERLEQQLEKATDRLYATGKSGSEGK